MSSLVKKFEWNPPFDGPLVAILADAIPCFSLDLINLIAQYYDIFQILDQNLSYFSVQVCTMCSSVNSNHIHLAGPNWKNDLVDNNPTGFFLNCYYCSVNHSNSANIHISHNMNLIIRSSEPFLINPDGSFRLSSPSNPTVSIESICDECLSKTNLIADSKPILSMKYFIHIVSHAIVRNNTFFFCPYWLSKSSQVITTNVPPLIPHALLGTPSPFYENGNIITEYKSLNPSQHKLFLQFADAHVNKLSEDVLLCDKCHKPNMKTCGICHCLAITGSSYSHFRVCTRSFCWSLFFITQPETSDLSKWCDCQ
jgi:hypothetical protein